MAVASILATPWRSISAIKNVTFAHLPKKESRANSEVIEQMRYGV